MARNFKLEYERYQGKPEQIKNRAMRNAARREAIKDGRARKGDGMDVDHKLPIAKGGGNGKGNTRVIPKSQNRSFPRTKKAKMR
jgi:hypothetical protein